MLQLILLRHASAVPHQGGADYVRPLSMQGLTEAHDIAEELRRLGLAPDVIVTSGALRTEQTAAVFLNRQQNGPQHVRDQRLYEAPLNAYFEVVHDFAGNDLNIMTSKTSQPPISVMVVGHNPAITDFANRLLGVHSGGEGGDNAKRHASKMAALNFSPASCGVFSCAIAGWHELAPHCATLDFWLSPQSIASRQLG